MTMHRRQIARHTPVSARPMRRLPHIILLVGIALLLLIDMRSIAHAQEDDRTCFEETGYCISGRIREYWLQNGGLYVFGYPISPQEEKVIEGQTFEAQEFERNRLELHPENAPPYDVLLGRLGVDRLEQQGRNWQDFPKSNAQQGCRFFPDTGHNVCGEFLAAWRADGLEIDGQEGKSEVENLALFGNPVSPPIVEEIEGNDYVVQYFERARFESHPENQAPYNVLFGLLGNEVREFAENPPDDDDDSNGDDDGNGNDDDDDDNGDDTPAPEPVARIAFASSREGNREIFRMNPDGSDVTNLTDHEGIDDTPAWSPDGTRVAFASERDGNREIYVMDADGSNQKRLTDNSADDWNPVWSPDGWRIAFETDRNGNTEIYVMSSVDGSSQSNLTNNSARDWNPDWSPDGDEIVFQTDRNSSYYRDIYVMDTDGSNQRNLTNTESRNERPAWSPDGRQIAFDSDLDGNREIYIMDADGDNIEQVTNDEGRDTAPTWSPDGEQLAFVSERDGNREIYVIDIDGDNEENISLNRADDRNPDWQPIAVPDEEDE